jgi:hypothetical protein
MGVAGCPGNSGDKANTVLAQEGVVAHISVYLLGRVHLLNYSNLKLTGGNNEPWHRKLWASVCRDL